MPISDRNVLYLLAAFMVAMITTESGILAADWRVMDLASPPEAPAVKIDIASIMRDETTGSDQTQVRYWKEVALTPASKHPEFKVWESANHLNSYGYRVYVLENCRTGSMAYKTPVLLDHNLQMIYQGGDALLKALMLPEQVIPDSPEERLHQLVCDSSKRAAIMPAKPLYAQFQGEDDPLWNKPTLAKRLTAMGQKIMQANGITEHIIFETGSEDMVNAVAQGSDNNIVIYKKLLDYLDNDDELAGVMSHEIAHLLHNHARKRLISLRIQQAILAGTVVAGAISARQNLTESELLDNPSRISRDDETALTGVLGPSARQSRKFETEADMTAIDLMVKAGYNPMAMITFAKKILSDTSTTKLWRSHPIGSDRLKAIRKKIAKDYPQFLSPEEKALLPQ